MKVREVIRMLEQDGWVLVRTRGSHRQYKRPAYSPDLPGCVSTGRSREEVEQNMREAIAFHLDGLREEGEPVPEPHTYSAYVELPA